MELLRHTSALEKVRPNSVEKGEETIYYKVIKSPVGLLTLVASQDALLQLNWGNNEASLQESSTLSAGRHASEVIKLAEKQLREYFTKKRTTFAIPLDPKGTPFQKKVWRELCNIPYGSYLTYGQQAERLGSPKSARAVGAANGRNPIGIIVPCHRVIGASGHLTGFAGGLAIKQALLELEDVLL